VLNLDNNKKNMVLVRLLKDLTRPKIRAHRFVPFKSNHHTFNHAIKEDKHKQ
jgi:hypothetical protein